MHRPAHAAIFTSIIHQRHPEDTRAQYQPELDLRALILRQLEQIPYVKDLVKRLKRDPCLREACRYGDKAPTEAARA